MRILDERFVAMDRRFSARYGVEGPDKLEGGHYVEVRVVRAERFELAEEHAGKEVLGMRGVLEDKEAIHGGENRDVGFEVGRRISVGK